jgi:hypothetical protein
LIGSPIKKSKADGIGELAAIGVTDHVDRERYPVAQIGTGALPQVLIGKKSSLDVRRLQGTTHRQK